MEEELNMLEELRDSSRKLVTYLEELGNKFDEMQMQNESMYLRIIYYKMLLDY